jgi:hypothetical protein
MWCGISRQRDSIVLQSAGYLNIKVGAPEERRMVKRIQYPADPVDCSLLDVNPFDKRNRLIYLLTIRHAIKERAGTVSGVIRFEGCK